MAQKKTAAKAATRAIVKPHSPPAAHTSKSPTAKPSKATPAAAPRAPATAAKPAPRKPAEAARKAPGADAGARAAKPAPATKSTSASVSKVSTSKHTAEAAKAVGKASRIVAKPQPRPEPVATKPAASPSLRPAVTPAAARPAAGMPSRAPQAPAMQRAMPAAVAKPAAPKLTSPALAGGAARAPAAPAPAAVDATKKPVSARHGFKTGESIVYPAHGVGKIVGIEEQEIAGISLELFVIQFEKDKMTLRVPTSKLQSVGMRKLAEEGIVNRAMETLKGKARIKRTMWSRRAQEYEAKINSGDLVSIAEVVRDLYRSEAQPEQSYSERQLYEAALDRMAREIAAVDKLDERAATQKITEVLAKSARGRRAAEEDAAGAEVKAA